MEKGTDKYKSREGGNACEIHMRKEGCNVVWWCHFLMVSWKTE